MGPIGGIVLKPVQLGQVFGAAASPAAALALEAPSDEHFDVLFNYSAAAAHRWSDEMKHFQISHALTFTRSQRQSSAAARR